MNQDQLVKSGTSENIDWQQFLQFAGHEFLICLNDDTTGLQAFVAIHSTRLGLALGGTRLKSYESQTEAIADVLNLSRAMSYKCALAHLPYGGGKAVIMANRQKSISREEFLASYARLIEKLGGLFKTGTDVGVTDDDVSVMAQHTAHMLGAAPADRGTLTTANTAALGVFYAMKAALQKLHGSDSFEGQRIAIKGVGKLGGELARLIVEAGGSVVIADVNESQCQSLANRLERVQIVTPELIHSQEVIIYAPCALGNEFNAQTIDQLHCQAVVGGANNQLSDDTAGDLLAAKNILYAPDYVANAGGLIYVADELEADGFSQARVIERTKRIAQTMTTIFEQAEQQGIATHRMADQLARSIIEAGL